ncbi:MAG TPA: glycosyltransferase [Solirubrobacteraceae bacterium]|nr:glycosyltransferase [Solirubrobacteraceae bacterium]
MRILVIVPWGQRLGGAEAMLQMVLDGAAQSGHEFELVFLEHGAWPRELAAAGFTVHVVPAGRLRQAHRTLLAIPRLARILRRSRPELILNWSAKTQLYGAPAAVLAGLSDRVVWWQQVIPRGHWVDRLATALPAVAVGCYSHAAADAQARMFPSRPTFVVAAGTPVPVPGAGPAALALPAGVPVIGLVGRLQRWKGQDRLLRAQKLLAERGQRSQVLIVGGDSYGLEPEYAGSLKPLAESLGMASAVTMTGEVPDAGPFIERMDVLVNASDPEPFGIVLLEAMARGVAVAAVDSGGPAEFIEHGRTGVLARSGEPADLADALEPLLRSPEKRWTIGAAGHARFLEEFTDAAMRDRFFYQFKKLIDEKG